MQINSAGHEKGGNGSNSGDNGNGGCDNPFPINGIVNCRIVFKVQFPLVCQSYDLDIAVFFFMANRKSVALQFHCPGIEIGLNH